MKKTNKFSPEVRERAVRMVQEQRGEYPSLWAAIESIAPKIGCVPQTLNEWVKRAEVDAGTREGVTTAEAQRVKELEREVKELRRANEILKLASAFFAQAELDWQAPCADSSLEGFYRPAAQCFRGRAALQGLADCPVSVLAPRRAGARASQTLRQSETRRIADAADSTSLAGQHAGLWRRQDMAATQA